MQEPTNGQNFNLYAYVLNNPLTLTNPSGFSWWTKNRATVIGIVVTVATWGAASAYAAGYLGAAACTAAPGIGTAMAAGAAGGFASAMVASHGDLEAGFKGAVIGAAQAGAFSLVGAYTAGMSPETAAATKVAAHSLIGCAGSAAEGSSCRAGALAAGAGAGVTVIGSAGLTAAGFGPANMSGDIGFREAALGVVAAVSGGTVSALSGGSFANGALTAAMAYVANQLSSQLQPPTAGPRIRSVFAAMDGDVSAVGWSNDSNPRAGYGFKLEIRTSIGTDLYGHMDPTSVSVYLGERVQQGQYLGMYADPTNGLSTGPHLHFERRDSSGRPINPGPVNVVAPGGGQGSGFGPRTIILNGQPNTHLHPGVDFVGPRY